VAVDLFRIDRGERMKELRFDLRGFPGRISVLLPKDLVGEVEGFRQGRHEAADRRAEEQDKRLREYIEQGRFDSHACHRMMMDIRSAARAPLLTTTRAAERDTPVVKGLRAPYGARVPLFSTSRPTT
jgi:hypothetical protein